MLPGKKCDTILFDEIQTGLYRKQRMQHFQNNFVSGLFAALILALFISGCGVGQESPRRTAAVEGKLVLTKDGVLINVPPHSYFVRDKVGEIVVEIDTEGSFFFAVVPHGGSDLQFIDGDKRLAIPLPPLENDETVRLGLRYEIDGSVLTSEAIGVDSGSEVTPTPASSGGGTGVPATRTPGIARPTPAGSSPFDSQGNTSGFGIPGGLSGNISVGRRLYQQQCTSCHGEVGGGWRFGRLKTRIGQSPMFLSIPDRDLANITAYLNRGAR